MTTYLGKSCSFGLPRVPFVNCRQFMYLVISLLVLRAGCGIWLYQFLIIAYLFTLCNDWTQSVLLQTREREIRHMRSHPSPAANTAGPCPRWIKSGRTPWHRKLPCTLPRYLYLFGTESLINVCCFLLLLFIHVYIHKSFYCLLKIYWHKETAMFGLFYYKIWWEYILKHVKIAYFDVFSPISI